MLIVFFVTVLCALMYSAKSVYDHISIYKCWAHLWCSMS